MLKILILICTLNYLFSVLIAFNLQLTIENYTFLYESKINTL